MRLRIFLLASLLFSLTFSGCSKKPSIQWEKFEPELMELAQQGDQPILAYFYAAWCPPCYELKQSTFRDPGVLEISTAYRRIKFDMSFSRSPEIQDLHRQYQVRGLPHMILMWPGDDPSDWQRMRGYVSPSRFQEYLTSFLNRPRA